MAGFVYCCTALCASRAFNIPGKAVSSPNTDQSYRGHPCILYVSLINCILTTSLVGRVTVLYYVPLTCLLHVLMVLATLLTLCLGSVCVGIINSIKCSSRRASHCNCNVHIKRLAQNGHPCASCGHSWLCDWYSDWNAGGIRPEEHVGESCIHALQVIRWWAVASKTGALMSIYILYTHCNSCHNVMWQTQIRYGTVNVPLASSFKPQATLMLGANGLCYRDLMQR